MKLLAIETTTESCSAALALGDELIQRSELAPRRHAERIIPMIDELLAEAGINRHALDVLAVGRGPGAFTGVRLGISLAQGMALGLDRPLIGVSSLQALALAAPLEAGHVLAVIDARMGELYAAAYRRDPEGELQPLGREQVAPAASLVLPDEAEWAVVGTGWLAAGEILESRLGPAVRSAQGERYPQALAVAQLAAAKFLRGEAMAPELVQPVYLRDKVAETLAERAAQRG
ncbi:tRNA (adenosine(37)-N6)-threonylcarbamoyltransferase complex dimerization subunit type 1 TsaB [Frateuria aurantia]